MMFIDANAADDQGEHRYQRAAAASLMSWRLPSIFVISVMSRMLKSSASPSWIRCRLVQQIGHLGHGRGISDAEFADTKITFTLVNRTGSGVSCCCTVLAAG